jgi:hypothetical protein
VPAKTGLCIGLLFRFASAPTVSLPVFPRAALRLVFQPLLF